MAEEVKKEEQKSDPKKILPMALKVVLGLVFLGLGVFAIMRWNQHLLVLIKGGIGLFFILVGIITLAIAKE